MIWIALSFLFFTVMVAVISAWKTRDDKLDTAEGYFLAGRGLPGIVIAGSLLLTNLSAEQLVGTNGQGWASNMSPIGWEVGALFTLFALALWFLPTYLKMGTTTIPQLMEARFGRGTKLMFSFVIVVMYSILNLPVILYSGAVVFENIFDISGIFGIGNGVWLIVGLVASLAIMAFGVGNGIEKANKVMMPALFFLFVVLGVYICTLPGASEGYKYIFTLKPEGLLNPQVWVFAFGQAFFSLSVAGNGSVIYGSYLPKDEDLPSSARNVALFDTIAALLAAIVIIPAMAVILGDGIVGMKGGPGLMFVYLVNVFNAMPGGRIVGMIFYICVLFAGVSSIVNLYEAPVAFLQEKLHTNRVLSVVIIGAVGGVIALCIQPWTSQWMDVVSIYICPLGALLAGIMFFWVMKKDTALAAVHEGRTVGKKDISGWFYPLGKWVYCAASLAALILGAIYGGIG